VRRGGGGVTRGRVPGKKIGSFLHLFLALFHHIVFANSFLILVKELGLLNNMGQRIRGFGCREIIYILYCKQ
jgi:hypothetical protein